MDKEILLYILFIAFVIISRLFKKKKNLSPPTAEVPDDASPKKNERALSFDELLKEFTREGKKPGTERSGDVEQKKEVEKESRVRETYQQSVREARKLKTIEEQVDLKAPIKLEHFKGDNPTDENQVAGDILASLQSTDGARRAIILSEILNRKY